MGVWGAYWTQHTIQIHSPEVVPDAGNGSGPKAKEGRLFLSTEQWTAQIWLDFNILILCHLSYCVLFVHLTNIQILLHDPSLFILSL